MALGTLTVFSSRPLASMWMFVFHSVSMVLDTLLLSSPGPACKVQGWHVNLCFLPSLYGLVFHFNKCYLSVYWKYTHNKLTIIDFFLPFSQFCSNIISNVLMHIISSFTLIPQFNGFTKWKDAKEMLWLQVNRISTMTSCCTVCHPLCFIPWQIIEKSNLRRNHIFMRPFSPSPCGRNCNVWGGVSYNETVMYVQSVTVEKEQRTRIYSQS